ncbi:MAG: polymer-forming cytoskeletal protein, partial [Acidimicrobiales bacterium]
MRRMRDQVRQLARRAVRRWVPGRLAGPLGLGLLVLAVAVGLASDRIRTQTIATPVPSPYYEIVGHSGSHEFTLLNLPITYVGAPQVPVPVDVNGDLLPDVTVALNLVNVPEGLVHNPPDLGDLVAPNLEINRLVTAPVLGQPSPPLRIEIRYKIDDLEGGPATIIQAGYDTGEGGSIPTYWKALLGGLQDFFNPMTVLLDTRPPLPNQWEPATYRGPQSIVGSVELPDSSIDFDLHYDPLPDEIRVSLGTDDEGTHVTYNHAAPRDVDLTTTIEQEAADGSKLDVEARVDRLPNNIAVDILTADGVGDLRYRSNSDGRAPDVGASIVRTPRNNSDEHPLVVDADIEGLPPEMHAHWEIPAEGEMSFDFDSPFTGIGAIQAEVRDYFGPDPAGFAFVPTEQQFASYHHEGERSLIRARVERIRSVSFEQIADGIDASMEIGDGQLPLEVQVVHDDFDQDGTAMDAHAVVNPLPEELSFSMRTPEPGSVGEPLTVSYDTGESGQSTDVDAELRVVERDTSPTTCGSPGVLCAELDVRHLPAHIDASIVNVTPLDSRVTVDMVPRPGGAEPDVFASVVMAQKPEPPEGDDPPTPPPDPIVADVSVFGLPEHMRVRLANRILDEGHTTEREAFERAEFHACSWDFDAATPGCTDTEGRIDAIDFAFRNFVTGDPLPPLLPETPLWVTVVGRGGAEPTDSVRFEAEGHITDIAEVQLLSNDDVFGLRTDVGGNQPLSALIDFEDLPIVFEEATDTDPDVFHRLDLEASATIDPLPQNLDFCFQEKDRDIVSPAAPFTEACQNADPFGDDDGPGDASRTPLALAYEGTDGSDQPQEFDVLTTVDLNERGDADLGPDVIDDDQHVRGHVDVFHLPGTFTAFVDSPPDDEDGNPTEGPLRVEYDANTPLGADQVRVEFGVEVTDADFLCRDPRPMPLGKMALCAEAVIDNLPTEVSLFYDPNLSAENFILDTSGSESIDVTGLEASLVEGELVDRNDPQTPEDESDDTLETSVLVLTGHLLDLPQDVTGTLVLPGTIDVTASPPIGEVDVTIQNFIGPDPLPDEVPDQRAGVPGPAQADQQFTVFQRDRFFRGHAHVTNVRGFAFATARDAENPDKLLDTNTIRIAFGDPSQTVRAYADMQFFAEHNPDGSPAPTSLVSIIGDVTLQHVPEEVTLCIRGKKSVAGMPLNPTFCDLAPANDDEGAFSFVGNPGTSTDLLDIYAFVRFAQAGGSDVLSARVDLIDIPHVVQGRFRTEGGSRVEFATFSDVDDDGFGVDEQGIGSIQFDFADFDIDTHGYDPNETPPWGALSKVGTVEPFPAAPAGQHLRLHLNDADMRVRGRVDDLQAVLFDERPCDAPTDPAPDSYPYYPEGLGEAYTCIRAQFQNDADERLDLAVLIDKAGTRISLRDAGLTRIPDLIQATIAKSETLNPDTSLRAPCPDITPDPGNISCMPPMLRLDTSGDAPVDSTLFGVLEIGTPDDLDDIRDYQPRDDLADLDALPETWSDWGPDNTGARLRVVQFGKGTEDETDDRTAITAGLRIVVPESLTVDQFQSWSATTDENGDGRTDESTDLRFRYVVLDDADDPPGGPDVVVDRIGELAAMVHDADKGDQILASDDDDEFRGLTIPGELALTMFLRHHVVPEELGCDDNPICHDKLFIQIEGRVSESIDARVRVLGGGEASIQDIAADIRDLPDIDGVPDDEPSFVLRAEMDKNVGEPGLSGLEEALLCIVYCIQTDIGLESLTAGFDFEPLDDGNPARRVDAYIAMDGAANAIELRGYEDIHALSGAEGDQPIDADVHIAINPMIVFIHIGVNPILGFDLFLGGELRIDAVIDNAEEFRINSKILHLVLEQERGGDSSVDVNLHVYGLAAASFLWLFFIPPIPLYVATFLPPSLPPPVPPPVGSAIIGWRPCPSPFPIYFNTIPLSGTDSEDVTAWIDDPRFIRFGILVPVIDLLVPVIFCAVGGDLPLIDQSPGHPGQPFEAQFHPVTGLEGVVAAPPPIPEPPPPPELVVSDGQTLALCGAPAIRNVVVEPGGVLQVATTADNTDIPFVDAESPPQPRCPAGSEGSLELNAGTDIDISGTVQGPAAPGRLIITADHVLVDDNGGNPDGVVQAGTGKVTLQSSGTVDIEGDVLADEVIPANTSGATGGGGAGHGGAGGNGGASGSGGAAYGDTTFDPLQDETEPFDPDVGHVPIEPGAGGSAPGVGTAGAGGGMIYIQGTVVNVAASGLVSADGGDGSDNHAVDEYCSVNVNFDDTDPDADVDNSHSQLFPNTGQHGAGGGSGGAIFISGTRVNVNGAVTATGGDGGDGIAGGGGGGSGGLVKISAALLTGAPDVSGGTGGSSACPANPPATFFDPDADSVSNATARPEFPAGGDGADELAIIQLGPHSSATPLGAFFVRAESSAALSVPYVAAAPLLVPGATNEIVLCGLRRPPESFRIDDDDDDDANDIDMAISPTVSAPCGTPDGSDDPDTPTSVHQLGVQDIPGEEAPAGADFDVELSNGYWAFYTVILRNGSALDPTNSCTDHGDFVFPFLTGTQYDNAACSLEQLPLDPDVSAGVDNDDPTVTIDAPEVSEGATVAVAISGVADTMATDDAGFSENPLQNFSGVLAIECGTDNVNWAECGQGLHPVTFTGDGSNTVYVRVTDVAGNQTTATDTVVVDAAAPESIA